MPQNKNKRNQLQNFSFLEFFAGSGLVAYALKDYFYTKWANDICTKKASVYVSNHGFGQLHIADICSVQGNLLPATHLSWASFPCQDLSLAGLTGGIHAQRSGLVWEWLRIFDEMIDKPPILVAENVAGLVSTKNGGYYRVLHEALRERGFKVGAVILDAARWVPQSRPRVFVIAVREDLVIPSHLIADGPIWLHPSAVVRAAKDLENWVWWNLPEPASRQQDLIDILEWDAPCHDEETTHQTLKLIPDRHMERLMQEDVIVAAGYKRTRNGRQVLELRFDGIAGCLRTPEGGSSRQFLVLKKDGVLKTRLLTIRETARLMGAPDTYELPGTYNDGYRAMGDAVAVPVAHFLAKQLLAPLATAYTEHLKTANTEDRYVG
ncbi:DNA cytosine methyltransferase [Brevibacillus panacihumi]|uniref:DNA (cytosine-5-)-methyltransferase n=1 Tax=Brevibacillus panacihumi TaxID=497735 RepID=A0A3M8CLT6_9BACL|nr:DNA (cytosine-5-)-methyltransferase [Brevibacillus panacihumi]RNB76690.1 DNA cytosine methyltransferase [Brevibacillus panacihumi]